MHDHPIGAMGEFLRTRAALVSLTDSVGQPSGGNIDVRCSSWSGVAT